MEMLLLSSTKLYKMTMVLTEAQTMVLTEAQMMVLTEAQTMVKKLKLSTLRLLHMRLVKIKHSSLMMRDCQEIISPLRKVVLVLLVVILFRWMLIALQLMLLMGKSQIIHNLILITLTLRDLH